MLEVGATGVGLIEETYVPGVFSARGAEKGYFAFGGSTVMCFLNREKSVWLPICWKRRKKAWSCLPGRVI